MQQVFVNGIFHSAEGQKQERPGPGAHLFQRMKRAISGLLVLTVAAALTATGFTAASYAGACGQLTGFAGFLQRAGLVAPGPCDTKPKGTVCQSGACTTSDRKPGKCRNIAVSGPANCACVASTVSPGLR